MLMLLYPKYRIIVRARRLTAADVSLLGEMKEARRRSGIALPGILHIVNG